MHREDVSSIRSSSYTSSVAFPQAPVWHPDVRFFKLSVQGQPKAYFYLDPYSRPEEKRGGAWMAEVHHGSITTSISPGPAQSCGVCTQQHAYAVSGQIQVEATLRPASYAVLFCRCVDRASCLRQQAPECGCPLRTW